MNLLVAELGLTRRFESLGVHVSSLLGTCDANASDELLGQRLAMYPCLPRLRVGCLVLRMLD